MKNNGVSFIVFSIQVDNALPGILNLKDFEMIYILYADHFVLKTCHYFD